MKLQIKEQRINKMMLWLLAISFILRGILAAILEFGNDEVYYWTYALYPDRSHFDHPPMVGWVIQLFTLNLLFDSEFFIRLASIVFMTADTYIIYRIGKDIKDAQTGLYAALLYTASIYCFVITGIFIMPDTPLMMFWLLAFWMAIIYFKRLHTEKHSDSYMTLFGTFTGLAMLSKYSGVFLWFGMILYILIFDRKPLKTWAFYGSVLISVLLVLPVLQWNTQYNFISFSFHGDRIGLGKINFGTFGTELAGEFLYNNPVNFILIVVSLVAAFKKKIHLEKSTQRLLLCTTLPLIAVFQIISLTRPTLPHWNAPTYSLLILLVACWQSEKNIKKEGRIRIPRGTAAALCVMLFVVVFGAIEIQTGFIPLDRHTEPEMLGRNDFTLDMFGWRQLETKFDALRQQKIAEDVMNEEDGIVADEWFPLANLDYYVARPLDMKVMGIGWPHNLHKYLWINEKRGGFHKGENFWFLTDSHYFKRPEALYPGGFESIEFIDTITIERCGKPAKNFFVYACKGLVYMQPSITELITERYTAKQNPNQP